MHLHNNHDKISAPLTSRTLKFMSVACTKWEHMPHQNGYWNGSPCSSIALLVPMTHAPEVRFSLWVWEDPCCSEGHTDWSHDLLKNSTERNTHFHRRCVCCGNISEKYIKRIFPLLVYEIEICVNHDHFGNITMWKIETNKTHPH